MEKYNISSAYETVKTGIRGYLFKDGKGKYVIQEKDRLPFYLEGMPGVGKTQIVREIAQDLGIGFVSFSLTHHTRNTVLGLPVIDTMENGDKYTRYTMSEIIESVCEKVAAGEKEGILLLDEFPCMAESIIPVMLAFLQTKNIGRHTLPEGWVIVLCGNPPKFNKSARRFDAAVLDRVRVIEIDYNVSAFLTYAKKRGLHKSVIDYLQMYPDNLYKCEKTEEGMELVTCRGWENLSVVLGVYEQMGEYPDTALVGQYIKSETIAANFLGYYSQYFSGYSKEFFRKVIMGAAGEKEKSLYESQNVRGQWKFIDYCIQYILSRHQKARNGSKSQENMAAETAAMIDFVLGCKSRESVVTKLFQSIKKTETVVIALTKFPQSCYTGLCREYYRGKEAV